MEKPRSEKLRSKYVVYRIDESKGRAYTTGPALYATEPESVDSPFVLMPRKDPAAFAALVTYMNFCEPQLANEIRSWLRRVAEADPVFGSQGARNLAYMRGRTLQGEEF